MRDINAEYSSQMRGKDEERIKRIKIRKRRKKRKKKHKYETVKICMGYVK